jgi:amidophosphoribosyltransferase
MCGIFGVHSPDSDAVALTRRGLFALQHRGQESAGVAIGERAGVRIHRDMGLVADVFAAAAVGRASGVVAVGHTRYSTAGASSAENAQPVPFHHPVLGPAALVHNGNLVNAAAVRRELEREGCSFASDLDTEVIARLVERTPGEDWEQVLRRAAARISGAYSCLIVSAGAIVALRDPWGFRPLSLGCLGRGARRAYVVASETCALDAVGATFLREIEAGEMVVVSDRGLRCARVSPARPRAACLFEFIYIARPDSILMGAEVGEARVRMGAELAAEHPVAADVVVGVPETANPVAIGYAERSAIPLREGLIKSRYANRTFIQPTQSMREADVARKLHPLRHSLRGKRLVLVDDSIVRGTTTRRVVEILRDAGASEVHVRVSSPPVRFPCFMGVDIGTSEQLIAAGRTVEEVCERIGADSLAHLSMAGLMRALGCRTEGFCRACFDGRYPLAVHS